VGDGLTAVDALTADGDELDRLLSGLDDGQWTRPTPAPGWNVTDQVVHLTAAFRLAHLAAADPDRYVALSAQDRPGFGAFLTTATAELAGTPPAVLLQLWRQGRAATAAAIAALPPGRDVPWLARPLPAEMLAMVGMMELFAHGQDIADAVGAAPVRTDRIEWIVRLIARTWDFGYHSRGMPVPGAAPRFEVTAPSGTLWRAGPAEAEDLVTGSALDLCLLATRRRHRDDLTLRATGPHADRWLDIAQAYRGPTGPERRAGQFLRTTVPSSTGTGGAPG
jgi:uncharacterized protein (TIGR03084 family)